MNARRVIAVVALFLAATILLSSIVVSAQEKDGAKADGVKVIAHPDERRVDVLIDGAPFTSYVYPEVLKKPVLYPLRTANGTIVTRGFPLMPRAGERVDHPHHAGLWFNYGDVNGVDFWNNSTSLAPAEQSRMGAIVQRQIVRTTDGAQAGELAIVADWMMPDKSALLTEETTFRFYKGPREGYRAIDRTTRLTAHDKDARFRDNKEGLLGLRVARWLEHPADKPEIYTDANGRATTVAALNNKGVTGHYRTSEGIEGEAVWGTRARWAMLTGKNGEGREATIAILDHPDNPGFPTYWHARGYGLFAANPLGRKVFSNGREEFNFTIKPGQTATFRYRILLLDVIATPSQIEEQYKKFVADISATVK